TATPRVKPSTVGWGLPEPGSGFAMPARSNPTGVRERSIALWRDVVMPVPYTAGVSASWKFWLDRASDYEGQSGRSPVSPSVTDWHGSRGRTGSYPTGGEDADQVLQLLFQRVPAQQRTAGAPSEEPQSLALEALHTGQCRAGRRDHFLIGTVVGAFTSSL